MKNNWKLKKILIFYFLLFLLFKISLTKWHFFLIFYFKRLLEKIDKHSIKQSRNQLSRNNILNENFQKIKEKNQKN